MTKIFEALQNATRDREIAPDRALALLPQSLPERVSHDLPAARKAPARPGSLTQQLGPQMAQAYYAIQSQLPYSEGNILQFLSNGTGEGCSTIAREFAKMAAQEMEKTVVLLDGDARRPTQMSAFGVTPERGWGECVRGEAALEEALYQLDEGRLYVGQLNGADGSNIKLSTLRTVGEFLADLARRYDLVIVDSPPLVESGEALSLAGKVDGVALVVEAEKTRRDVVKKATERIAKFDGRVLGVILNNYRSPIPAFLDHRL